MTTDTYPKAISVPVDENATITIVAKGAGMIEPNMATMLAFIFTDAHIENPALDDCLRKAVDKSFNMLSIDTDTSTSDTCIIMANGMAGKVNKEKFQQALDFASIEMTKIIAKDAEGATKLLVSEVNNAYSDKEAVTIAKSIINSPLIKTMAYGGDPNIGRILMAVGKCFESRIIAEKINISLNGMLIFSEGEKTGYNEEEVRKMLKGKEVKITVNLNVGSARATAYGCDLTEGYIKENAAYYSS